MPKKSFSLFMPATLQARILILFCVALVLVQSVNLFSLKNIQEGYIRQTMRERINIAASRYILMDSFTPSERDRALSDLEKYYDESWNVGHAFYAKLDSPPNGDNSAISAQIATAIHERLSEKGKSPAAEIKAYIFDNYEHFGHNGELDKLLSTVPADRFPVLEIAMRLTDDTWFCIFQSMQFESSALIWLQLAQLLGITLIFFVILFMLIKFVTRPLRELALAAEHFGEKPEQAEIIAEKGAREVLVAIRSFNGMSQNLRDNLDERNKMLVAMAHDLKTPLAKIQLRLEDVENEELRQKLLDNCADMLSTVNNCLELARSLKTDEPFVQVDMVAFVQSLADDYSELGQNVACRIEVEQPVFLETRPVCLKRCVINLVENALRYAGNAELILREQAGTPVLSIADHGPGVPAEELEKIFRPWYRLECSRNKATGGTGLGLAIAKNMAFLCNAHIRPENRKGGGLWVGEYFQALVST